MVNSLDRRLGGTLTRTAASHRGQSRHACPDGPGGLGGPGQAPIREATGRGAAMFAARPAPLRQLHLHLEEPMGGVGGQLPRRNRHVRLAMDDNTYFIMDNSTQISFVPAQSYTHSRVPSYFISPSS